jgi:phage shock protein A
MGVTLATETASGPGHAREKPRSGWAEGGWRPRAARFAAWISARAASLRHSYPVTVDIDKEQIDMSLFQRAHDILAAKTNKALDAAEKPDEMLDLSYEQMLDQITKVRQALVTIAASRKQIELQEQQLQHSVDHLQEQAMTALSLGKEDLAREALTRKAAAQAQIDAMEPQHQQLTEQEEKLTQTLQALQQRVNSFRTQKEVLKAQYAAASAESSVNESVAGISGTLDDSGAAVQRAQDKIANMQARAGALDELLQSGVLEDVGGDTDDIQKELDEAGTAADVDNELAALKAQIGPGSSPPELTSG